MISEETTRQLLIESCHSSREADEKLLGHLSSSEFVSLLVKIALDEDDYQGDAPMQAAYYLSQAPVTLAKPFEKKLIGLLTAANGYGGHIALTLGRMRSDTAKPVITEELENGERFDAWLYKEALKQYETPSV